MNVDDGAVAERGEEVNIISGCSGGGGYLRIVCVYFVGVTPHGNMKKRGRPER